ncbi:ferritin-like domain-containing protein [Conyzicola sp.]|uniref:ferritin-like domain-containing protein n=1 Tax=Conyzicola sp. TaxID=1969404 RepID=UPI0039890C9C
MTSFDDWVVHFEANDEHHRATEPMIDWSSPAEVQGRARGAFVRSFQRFELGESGEGAHLLDLAAAAGDPAYTEALTLLVREEQKHSALFGRALGYLGAPTLDSHWSDAAFTRLRRLLGLRTEIGLFLIAESVAMGYFVALAERAPDPVLRAVGRRIADDERDHIRFQVDRLRVGFRGTPMPLRALVGVAWGVVAAGAATVLVVDHGQALRACGVSPIEYWGRAMRSFRAAARSVLKNPEATLLGPTPLAPARAAG